VTHAKKLIGTLEEQKGCNSVRLEKEFGETKVVGTDKLNMPVWHWAAR
jgi:predicted ATPase